MYSTRQRSYRAESSHEKLMPYSSSLGRTVGLVGRRLQRLGLGFFFFPLPPNPQSNLPQQRTVSERHPNASTYLRWLFLTTSLYYLPVLRAVSQAKKTKLDKIAVWQAGTYKHGVPLSVTRFVLAPRRALRPCSSSGKEPIGSTHLLPFQLTFKTQPPSPYFLSALKQCYLLKSNTQSQCFPCVHYLYHLTFKQ